MGFKPLGRKNYGSIAHLPCSRMGPADRKITEGQARIATVKKRDKHDRIIVQEKLDGSNVGVAMVGDEIFALTRSGYEAKTSRFEFHRKFSFWVYVNEERFRAVLKPGERICGELMTVAHGTRYNLPHEPFVAFDVFDSKNKRILFHDFVLKVGGIFDIPYIVNVGDAISVQNVMNHLGTYGKHGAIDPIEGAVWRVERKGVVDFLCKYVRPNKIDGNFLGKDDILNKWP